MTTKINNENAESGLLPYPVIIAATKGDPEAMSLSKRIRMKSKRLI